MGNEPCLCNFVSRQCNDIFSHIFQIVCQNFLSLPLFSCFMSFFEFIDDLVSNHA